MSMEVEALLQKFFHKKLDEALKITMMVHNQGRGPAGIFSAILLETKVVQVGDHAA